MKDYFKLEKREINCYEELKIRAQLRNNAIEHGYVGMFGTVRFVFRRNLNNLLQIIADVIPFSRIRVRLQKMRGVKIGEKATIGPRCSIDTDYPNYCIIKDGATLSGYNIILCHNKPLKVHSNLMESFVAPTIIGKNADIAIGVIVLPGVEIGENSIIGAGAVVTKSIPRNCLAVGVPAKIIRTFEMNENVPIGYNKESEITNNHLLGNEDDS